MKLIGRVVLVIIVLIALGIEMTRRYVTQATPKKGGFILSPAAAKATAPHNVLLVGGTNGIGKGLAQELLKRGINVTVVGRSEPKDLKGARFVKADLFSMKVAKETVDKLKGEKFDVIFFTQGILPMELTRTSEGIESDLAVSYLSRYVMIKEFLANGLDKIKLESGRRPRVFIMGAPGSDHVPILEDVNWEMKNHNFSAHMNTVIFNEAIVYHFAKKYPSVEFFGLHPGLILTNILRVFTNQMINSLVEGIVWFLFPSVETYAEMILFPLLGHPNIKSGMIFNQQGNEIVSNPWFDDDVRDSHVSQVISVTESILEKFGLP